MLPAVRKGARCNPERLEGAKGVQSSCLYMHAQVTVLPAQVAALPCRVTALPCRVTALPCRVTALPAQVTALPCQITALPCRVIALPRWVAALPISPLLRWLALGVLEGVKGRAAGGVWGC